ncbi:Tat (twin-arginine translocation) pathway signal sequence containing protein [Devosia insulae DS-56]|uniref:Tat (Twin-arginine translocation) pathway signal sequence containing protein n=1 Tax=Devosia insulae DS-56 TaxID=1116389 RepID=A0A1E5XPF8_9HYPH|nr:ferritin-like domain-containing protein [Devosia insulae]OEO30490.1 Tat (twin-arginine translocation) pathway signal sequence containing protein [Devosia insulae DS-56]
MHVQQDRSRRWLLKWSAASAAGVAIGGALLPNFGISAALAADLGEGDVGVLNYAYALEQLEAAFYTMVVDSPYADISGDETALLTDIRDHEVEHREFLKKALGDGAIPALEVDFSAVDFKSRASVLGTAMVFEDLGVGAYNGAGKLIENPDYLLAAGKIVSVEARHAAAIRDLLNPNSVSFAGDDVVDKNGLDVAYAPTEVLPKAGPFIKTDVTANSFM